jgi:hypothetical protein
MQQLLPAGHARITGQVDEAKRVDHHTSFAALSQGSLPVFLKAIMLVFSDGRAAKPQKRHSV